MGENISQHKWNETRWVLDLNTFLNLCDSKHKEVCSELLLHHPPSEPWQPQALNEALFFIAGWRILFLADGSLPGAAGQLHIQGMEVHYFKADKNLILSVLRKENSSSLNLKRDEADKSIADPQFEFGVSINEYNLQQTFILQLAGIFFWLMLSLLSWC